jgi:hypothetical protein
LATPARCRAAATTKRSRSDGRRAGWRERTLLDRRIPPGSAAVDAAAGAHLDEASDYLLPI